MFTGGLMTEDMGLEEINGDSFINHFVYILFIFMMVILFLNVFTGISIDAVSELIKNSVADGISNKIEYVDKIEEIMTNTNNKFLFIVRKLFVILDTMIRKIYSLKERKSNEKKITCKLFSKMTIFFDECKKNYKNSKKTDREENSNQFSEKLDKLNKLIIELKSESNNILEKLEIISKRVNLVETNLDLQIDQKSK
ncbi:unnamed protein product [Brachionus calyciflorus]|uniref:Uncharacterized protein n=1 Tax=Brachionus calyciflorus TaxID=104777 RepID=A0A814JJ62_9BILA|nr:unnamed protein product [Brachionus calyciflorus]